MCAPLPAVVRQRIQGHADCGEAAAAAGGGESLPAQHPRPRLCAASVGGGSRCQPRLHPPLQVHVQAVVSGGKFLQTFFKALPFWARVYQSHPSNFHEMVRGVDIVSVIGAAACLPGPAPLNRHCCDAPELLQVGTIEKGVRVVQTLCNEGKFQKALPLTAKVGGLSWQLSLAVLGAVPRLANSLASLLASSAATLLAQVPAVKRTVERFMFHIKALLAGGWFGQGMALHGAQL